MSEKIWIADRVDPLFKEVLSERGYQVIEDFQSVPGENQTSEIHGLIIRSRFPLTAENLEQLPLLRFLGRVGAGMENIDIEAAEKRGITVVNAPEGNRDAVGEHALGMLLNLLNNIRRADAEVRNGLWRREANRGTELAGKTVGIIGYGYMGSAFAEKLSGLGVNILAYDKYKTGFGSEHVKEVSLRELQAQSDIVSLHVDQRPENVALLDEAFLSSFTKPFILINTARGKSLVTSDLVKLLQSGKIKGACLDVLEYEKSSFENLFSQPVSDDLRYLMESDRVLLTPHIAGWTGESKRKMAEVILQKLKTHGF